MEALNREQLDQWPRHRVREKGPIEKNSSILPSGSIFRSSLRLMAR